MMREMIARCQITVLLDLKISDHRGWIRYGAYQEMSSVVGRARVGQRTQPPRSIDVCMPWKRKLV